jgi:hypothetical protein
MIRAKSCWYSGERDWMAGTASHQTWRNEAKAGGQFAGERSTGDEVFDNRGRGTDGGDVVQRRAAK